MGGNDDTGIALVADIGGTNTRVALARGHRIEGASVRRFRNADHESGIAGILRTYMKESGARPVGLCVAGAGPVEDGRIELTNLDWTIDSDALRRATGIDHVAVLNDLQAQGHALGHVAPDRLRTIIPGPEAPGPMLVVGLGTGVNGAPVHGSGAARIVPPAECGHITMPVRTDEDRRLQVYVNALLAARGEPPHCGVEEVLSGRGLENLHAFARDARPGETPASSVEILAALARGDEGAVHAAALYTHVLGQFLADLALIFLPWRGIYLIGGMARAMSAHLAHFGIEAEFREKRRIDLLARWFRVSVVEDDYAALIGCAAWLAAARAGV